jgi:hypothetical protein
MIITSFKNNGYYFEYYLCNIYIGDAYVTVDKHNATLTCIDINYFDRHLGHRTKLLEYIKQYLLSNKITYLNIATHGICDDERYMWFNNHGFNINYEHNKYELDLLTIEKLENEDIFEYNIDKILIKYLAYISNDYLRTYITLCIKWYVLNGLKYGNITTLSIYNDINFMMNNNEQYNITKLNSIRKLELLNKINKEIVNNMRLQMTMKKLKK